MSPISQNKVHVKFKDLFSTTGSWKRHGAFPFVVVSLQCAVVWRARYLKVRVLMWMTDLRFLHMINSFYRLIYRCTQLSRQHEEEILEKTNVGGGSPLFFPATWLT